MFVDDDGRRWSSRSVRRPAPSGGRATRTGHRFDASERRKGGHTGHSGGGWTDVRAVGVPGAATNQLGPTIRHHLRRLTFTWRMLRPIGGRNPPRSGWLLLFYRKRGEQRRRRRRRRTANKSAAWQLSTGYCSSLVYLAVWLPTCACLSVCLPAYLE